MGDRGLSTRERETHTLAEAVTLATTHSLTKKFLGRPGLGEGWSRPAGLTTLGLPTRFGHLVETVGV